MQEQTEAGNYEGQNMEFKCPWKVGLKRLKPRKELWRRLGHLRIKEGIYCMLGVRG